jgi:hypothetical protein
MTFVSRTCEGERCFCGQSAAHKVEESIAFDDPRPRRHPLTSYICHEHFRQIMRPAAERGRWRSCAPEEREQFYDREIAPVLLDLARRCQNNGLSIAAMVEWAPGETGRTPALAAGSGVGIRVAELAMQARGNVDSLLLALMKYGKKHGHNSVFLHLLERPVEGHPQ